MCTPNVACVYQSPPGQVVCIHSCNPELRVSMCAACVCRMCVPPSVTVDGSSAEAELTGSPRSRPSRPPEDAFALFSQTNGHHIVINQRIAYGAECWGRMLLLNVSIDVPYQLKRTGKGYHVPTHSLTAWTHGAAD